jgi:hypothetical protein
MEHEEFISKAKEHFAGTVARDATPPSPEDFPNVRVRESVVVYFQSEDKKNDVWVLLDRATGKFLGGWSRIRGHNQGQIQEP